MGDLDTDTAGIPYAKQQAIIRVAQACASLSFLGSTVIIVAYFRFKQVSVPLLPRGLKSGVYIGTCGGGVLARWSNLCEGWCFCRCLLGLTRRLPRSAITPCRWCCLCARSLAHVGNRSRVESAESPHNKSRAGMYLRSKELQRHSLELRLLYRSACNHCRYVCCEQFMANKLPARRATAAGFQQPICHTNRFGVLSAPLCLFVPSLTPLSLFQRFLPHNTFPGTLRNRSDACCCGKHYTGTCSATNILISGEAYCVISSTT